MTVPGAPPTSPSWHSRHGSTGRAAARAGFRAANRG